MPELPLISWTWAEGAVDWLWLVPALPLAGFLLLALMGGRLGRHGVAWVGCASVGLAAVAAAAVAIGFLGQYPSTPAVTQTLWTWMALGGDLNPSVALRLDPLSLVMMLVVTGLGFLIHVYAAGYLQGDEGLRRFFAVMNLFVAFMLVLVLAADLLLLFLGWEGVGLCSYLLIGHWYRQPANGDAARKAFIVTRIGDAALLAGLLLLFTALGTSDIAELLARATAQWPPGSALASAAALLLLGGAVGKSAQVPLHVWLPDAMAGPTPVSALIHAATMVTAGVYLIARMLPLYEIAPAVLGLVGAIGALTLLLGAAIALAQRDIKRMLAWSTISQLGYMFLALGAGAVSAAIFHLMTHAFFNALLFLAAGAVIVSLGGERDILRMGGLWRQRPLAFWGFTTGAASLAALPLVTAGFYSKALVLDAVWAVDGHGGLLLWLAGVAGTLLTALYITRALVMIFFGPARTPPTGRYGITMAAPMGVLVLLALFGGGLDVAGLLAGLDAGGLQTAERPLRPELKLITLVAGLAGIGLGIRLGERWHRLGVAEVVPAPWQRRLEAGLGFDALYRALLLRPFLWLATASRRDWIDAAVEQLGAASRAGHRLLVSTQTGLLRWYAAASMLGGVLLIAALAALGLLLATPSGTPE
jgi:NADH-quinone oxidoreductase subunit L